jgi:uncharacterized DUF497 family protein
VRFEWDPDKAAANLLKPGVSFDEAQRVFADQFATTVHDPDHSFQDDRWLTTGSTDRDRVLIVSHTNRGDVIRIISARPAMAGERRTYESRK